MALLRYDHGSGPRLGRLLSSEELIPLNVSLAEGQGVETLLVDGVEETARRVAGVESGDPVALSDVTLLSPVPRPSKVIAVGLNYADHVAESNMPTPAVPAVFAKFPNSIVGPGEAILRPRASEQVDYEAELCIVIGRRCRNVPASRAAEVIGGYTILNDVSVRDLQLATQHWSLGKSFDTHGPTGPWVVTPDEVDPKAGLAVRTWVDDELRQDSDTSQLIFDCAALVEYISGFATLLPGDLIATGTPGGVGGAMDPPVYLRPGEEVRIEIEGIGTLMNPVAEEPADNVRIGEGSVSGAAR